MDYLDLTEQELIADSKVEKTIENERMEFASEWFDYINDDELSRSELKNIISTYL